MVRPHAQPVRRRGTATAFAGRSLLLAPALRRDVVTSPLERAGTKGNDHYRTVVERLAEVIELWALAFSADRDFLATVVNRTPAFFGAAGPIQEEQKITYRLLTERLRQGQEAGELRPDRDPHQTGRGVDRGDVAHHAQLAWALLGSSRRAAARSTRPGRRHLLSGAVTSARKG